MNTKLENEISLQNFRNEYHKGIVNIVYTYGFIHNELQQLFGNYNLTMQQFNILRILRGVHPRTCTNSYIKSRMLDKNSDVTRIINRLINQELVERKASTEDKRKVEIRIRRKGLDLLAEIDKESAREDALLESLSEDEICELNRLLNKIRSGFKKHETDELPETESGS